MSARVSKRAHKSGDKASAKKAVEALVAIAHSSDGSSDGDGGGGDSMFVPSPVRYNGKFFVVRRWILDSIKNSKVCTVCNNFTSTVTDVRRHVFMAHGSTSPARGPFSCSHADCMATFRTRTLQDIHDKRWHKAPAQEPAAAAAAAPVAVPGSFPILSPDHQRFIESIRCGVCGKQDDEPLLLLCDVCNKSEHTYCATPHLDSVPEGFWTCSKCHQESESDHASQDEASSHAASAERQFSSDDEEEGGGGAAAAAEDDTVAESKTPLGAIDSDTPRLRFTTSLVPVEMEATFSHPRMNGTRTVKIDGNSMGFRRVIGCVRITAADYLGVVSLSGANFLITSKNGAQAEEVTNMTDYPMVRTFFITRRSTKDTITFTADNGFGAVKVKIANPDLV